MVRMNSNSLPISCRNAGVYGLLHKINAEQQVDRLRNNLKIMLFLRLRFSYRLMTIDTGEAVAYGRNYSACTVRGELHGQFSSLE